MTLPWLLRGAPCTLLAIASLLASTPSMADPGSLAASAPHNDAQLDAILTFKAQEILDRMERLEGQSTDIRVQVSFDFRRARFGFILVLGSCRMTTAPASKISMTNSVIA